MQIPEILIEKLKSAHYVAVLTGAGVSAESGIKTFRDPDGLWTKLNPAELASIDGFMSNPKLVWENARKLKEGGLLEKVGRGRYRCSAFGESGFMMMSFALKRLRKALEELEEL